MPRSKPTSNTAVKHGHTALFLMEGTAKSATKMVSVRVSEDLLTRFQAAARKATERGFDLTMTRVIHQALEMAVQEVDEIVPAKQQDASSSKTAS